MKYTSFYFSICATALVVPFLVYASVVSGTIDVSSKYAWSENAGWINFGAPGGTVTVTDTILTGELWSDTYGWIHLAPALGGVTNTAEGVLGGSAWNSSLGWIDFSGVSIDSSGRFHGTASGVLSGTITFDCTHCAVQTDWRPALTRISAVTLPLNVQGNGPPQSGKSEGKTIDIPFAETSYENLSAPSGIENVQNGGAIGRSGSMAAAAGALFDIALSGEGLTSSAAPGDSVAFSVKLVNFGSQKRVDVTVSYRILDGAGRQVYAEQETVAVDTTASFVKRLPVPKDAAKGQYAVESSLSYVGQTAPAVSRFTFDVVPRTSGSPAPVPSVAWMILAAGSLGALGFGILVFRQRHGRFVAFDYSGKPKELRVYYEIISDSIGQMRLHSGDAALEIAGGIPDLRIDPDTGEVLSIGKNPSKILERLVLRYETLLGRGTPLIPRVIS
jgi:hypothetical protein